MTDEDAPRDESGVRDKWLGPYLLGPNDTPENGIYCGDARELAKAIPDKSIDLVLTDPPYWVGFDYGMSTDEEMTSVDPQWVGNEIKRIAFLGLVTTGRRVLFDYPRPDWIMAWDKGNSMKRYRWGFAHFEPIICYGFPDLPQCKMRPDVFRAPIIVEKGHSHVCPKPIKLATQLIETYTSPGECILDFFAGSGTFQVACKMLGRHYLAFEIDPDTCALARERVRQTQPPLFVPEPEQAELWPGS